MTVKGLLLDSETLLTWREVDVISCLMKGVSAKNTAPILSISHRTVETHIQNVYKKTNTYSRESLAKKVNASSIKQALEERFEKLLELQEYIEIATKSLNKKPITEIGELIIPELTGQLRHDLMHYLAEIFIDAKPAKKNGCNGIRVNVDEVQTTQSTLEIQASQDSIQALNTVLKTIYGSTLVKSIERQRLKNTKVGMEKPTPTTPKLKVWGSVFASIVLVISLGAYIIISPTNKTNPHAMYGKQWNLPSNLQYYTNRNEIVESVWDRFLTPTKKDKAITVGLYGLGGAGKTTLATHLIHYPQTKYELRAWFPAETKEILTASFIELGEKHQLFTSQSSSQLKVKIVKEWLEKHNSLLVVFDNAPDMETLKEFMPNKGNILITTRNFRVLGALEVQTMSKKEAQKLFETLIPASYQKEENYQEEMNTILRSLEYLPLAIAQAGSYIHENKITLAGYLQLFESGMGQLLFEKNLPAGDQHDPVFVTWDLNIQALANEENSDMALDVLNLISLCHAEAIPKDLLMHYLFGDISVQNEIKLNNALTTLRKYSLVRLTQNGDVSIHRLTQKWMKQRLTKYVATTTLQRAVKTIKAIYPFEIVKSVQQIQLARTLKPHLISVMNYANSEHKKNQFEILKVMHIDCLGTIGDVINFNKEMDQNVDNVYALLSSIDSKTEVIITTNAYHLLRYGKYKQALALAEEILRKTERQSSDNVPLTIYLQTIISVCHLWLGLYKQAEQEFEELLKESKKHASMQNSILPNTLQWYGVAQLYLGNYKDAHQALLKGRESNLTNKYNDFKFGASKLNLGWCLLYLGDYDKASHLLAGANDSFVKTYGEHSIQTTYSKRGLAIILAINEQIDEAQHLMNDAIHKRTTLLGPKHVRLGYIYNTQGLISSYAKNPVKAKHFFNKAVDIIEDQFGANHILAMRVRINIGAVERLNQNPERALKLLQQSYDEFTANNDPLDLNIGIILANMALAHGDLGDQEKKEFLLKEALVIFKKHLFKDHIYIQQAHEELKSTQDKTDSPGFIVVC